MVKFSIHPYARIFPPMDRAALDALLADLAKNGQQQPIIVTPKMEILDGLHRYRLMARMGMGMEMEHEVFEGTDEEALALVVSLNLVRRHMTTSQRAAVAAEIANMPRGGDHSAKLPNGISQPEAAKQVDVSTRSVGAATKIKKEGDHDLFEAVKKGKIDMEDAIKMLKLPKEKQNEIARSKNPAKEVKKATAKKSPLDKVLAGYNALSDEDKTKFLDPVNR
jgi:hypothetical protein